MATSVELPWDVRRPDRHEETFHRRSLHRTSCGHSWPRDGRRSGARHSAPEGPRHERQTMSRRPDGSCYANLAPRLDRASRAASGSPTADGRPPADVEIPRRHEPHFPAVPSRPKRIEVVAVDENALVEAPQLLPGGSADEDATVGRTAWISREELSYPMECPEGLSSGSG